MIKRLIEEIYEDIKLILKILVKRYVNVKYIFRALQLVALLNASMVMCSVDSIDISQLGNAVLYFIACIIAAILIQEIGAVVTRILYHFNLLRRKNVMHFIGEVNY